MPFPMTRIEDQEISRLMIGTNWFLGYSHYSGAKDRWIKQHMTLDRIVEVMCGFCREGINAIMSSPDPRIREAIDRVKAETGVECKWACTPSAEGLDDLLPEIERCAELGATFCMPHQHWTDGNMIVNQQRILGLEKVTERIRELGMIPGLSTHRPETVVLCDKAGYDVATYIQLYNPIGFLCQVETDWIERIINETKKPIMCIKPLAAGRVLPSVGFGYVYHSIKPIDTVCVGTLNPQEATEDIAIVRRLLGESAEEQELTYSRSKAALVR